MQFSLCAIIILCTTSFFLGFRCSEDVQSHLIWKLIKNRSYSRGLKIKGNSCLREASHICLVKQNEQNFLIYFHERQIFLHFMYFCNSSLVYASKFFYKSFSSKHAFDVWSLPSWKLSAVQRLLEPWQASNLVSYWLNLSGYKSLHVIPSALENQSGGGKTFKHFLKIKLKGCLCLKQAAVIFLFSGKTVLISSSSSLSCGWLFGNRL